MSYRTLKDNLDALDGKDSNATFSYFAQLAAFTSLADDEGELQQARDLLIRTLDRRDEFVGYESILQSLLRNVGLFPYLDVESRDVAEQLATEAHRPATMPEEIVFTAKQAEVYRELMAGRNVVLSAPTSFGKSLIIDAVIASEVHRNIVVVVPTLALVDETRRRLMRFKDRYKVITHLSQEPSSRNIFVHTQERVVESKHIRDVDFFVIDEFYKLQVEDHVNDSDARSVLLNQAFYKLVKRAKQFYMLGPNIHELPDGFGRNFRCTFVRTDFSTVASEIHTVRSAKDDETRLKQLVPDLNGPSLVFSGSVNRARKLGGVIADARDAAHVGGRLKQTIDWLSQAYHPNWGLVAALKRGVGIHHGKLPRSIGQMLVRLFNEQEIDFLVCTSTLIEGVNTAARNVVIVDNKIATRKYDYFTFNNIRGRSGRMWQHYVGHVYLFHPPPQPELEFVDVPAFTQSQSAPESLLVQMDRSDLSDLSREKLRPIWTQQVLGMETIQANSGFDPQGQIDLAIEIQGDLARATDKFGWSGYPTYDQLLATIELACKHLGFRSSSDVRSPKQLAFLVSKYAKNPSYQDQILGAIGNKTGLDADEALETFLDFTRQWLSFRVPRLLSAVDRIQREVLNRYGKRPGSYAFYCSQLESLFMDPVVVALEEYGVPIQLGMRIVPQLGDLKSLDEAIEALGSRPVSSLRGLSAFERELIRPLCAQ